MKRIYLFVLSALMMLMSTSAMAQSETVKGDVNGDGVVDVADIAAVIKIMTENGSIEKKYYWYAGQEKPVSMTEYPTPDDTTTPPTNNNWHTLSKDATSIGITVVGGTSGNAWYIAVPTSFGLKPTATDLATPNNTWTIIGTITVGTVEYTLWQPAHTSTRCAVYMAKI